MRWWAAGIAFVVFAGGGVAASESPSRFVDVPEGHVFASQIDWLADQGITRGCNPPVNDQFCPDQPVSRGQMAAFLVRALGLSEVDPELPVFVDSVDSMFLGDIMKLASAGITRGCNPPVNDLFCPDQPVSRGQMAAFLVRALGLSEVDPELPVFVDSVDSMFLGDIMKLASAGITRGCNPPVSDRFCPDQVVTRGQMAAFLARAIPDALRIDTSAVIGGTVGVHYTAALSVTGGTPPYAWQATGLPDGLFLADGVVDGFPTTAGTAVASIRVADADGDIAAAQITIDIDEPLVLETDRLPVWVVDEPTSSALVAVGGEPPYSWSASGLPSGLALDADGHVSGTSTDLGDHAVQVTVADTDGRTDERNLVLRVVSPFYVVTAAVVDGTVGETYTDRLQVSGGEDPFSWAATGLPDGLTLSSDGILSGIPVAAGSSSFDVTVTDGRSDTAEATVTIGLYDPISIATSWLPPATRGEPYWSAISAVGGKMPFTWFGAMPPGLALSPGGVISGTPTVTSDFGITVEVADSGGRTDLRNLSIDVAEPVAITNSSLPDGTVEETYDISMTATGGDGSYTWSGSMPPGLSLSNDGSLFGHPTEAGTFVVTFYASDSRGRTDSRRITVDIYDFMTVMTPSLSATVGAEYVSGLPSSGGKPPYTWEGNVVPSPFSLGSDGSLTGTPTIAGSFDFDITVSDSGGRQAFMAFTVDVDDPVSIPHSAMPDGWLYVPYDFTLQAEGGEAPFTWDRGEVPPGMGMYSYGEFVGAPLWGGYWDVPFTVTDADGRVAEKTLPLFVAGAKRMSVSYEDAEANAYILEGALSGDGRYAPFVTTANNLLEGDTDDDWDLYVYDNYSRKVTRVSVSSQGDEVPGDFRRPDVDYDGNRIVFQSGSVNLVPSGGNGWPQIYVRDTDAETTTRLSESATGEIGNNSSFAPAISNDGRYVAFWSSASNLVPGDTNGVGDIFVKDTSTGNVVRVSVASDGTEANSFSRDTPEISGDGRWVVFSSYASNLVPLDANGDEEDVFMHDLLTGTTTLVSSSYDGWGLNDSAGVPSVNADGSKVAFVSSASNVVRYDTNGLSDVFVFDRLSGETERVSYRLDGSQLTDAGCSHPMISGNGEVVLFSSGEGILPGDTDGAGDLYAVDLVGGRITLLSTGPFGANGPDTSTPMGISDDGAFAAFTSEAATLVPNDTNGFADYFIAAVDLRR